jgi:hypothetical protein
MYVGPLGIESTWPANIYFYETLPGWAGSWEQVCQSFCRGEGRAYHFVLDGADLASSDDITALYGGTLKAYDADKPIEPEASGEEKLAALDGILEHALNPKEHD